MFVKYQAVTCMQFSEFSIAIETVPFQMD